MTPSTDWPRIGPAAYRTTTQEDELRGEANPQVDGHFIASPQVAESISRTLSRWRHGFKSRWDYKRKTPGQGASPESIGSLNRDSNAEYPANIPHRIERSECAKGRAPRGWMHYRRVAARRLGRVRRWLSVGRDPRVSERLVVPEPCPC